MMSEVWEMNRENCSTVQPQGGFDSWGFDSWFGIIFYGSSHALPLCTIYLIVWRERSMYLCHLLKNKTAVFKLSRFANRIFLFLVSDLKVSTECLQFIIAFFVCKQISLHF